MITNRRYKYAANFCVNRIIQHWKKAFVKGKRKDTCTFEYESDFINFEVQAVINFKKGYGGYSVDGYTYEGNDYEQAHVLIIFTIDPEWLNDYWSEIYFDLCDVIRHEMEHMTQDGWNIKDTKYIESDHAQRDLISSGELKKYKYLLLPKEIDANLQGMAFRCRKERRTFIDVINQYLDRLELVEEERQEILEVWRNRSKHIGGLPKF
jgi:hypothetical protein